MGITGSFRGSYLCSNHEATHRHSKEVKAPQGALASKSHRQTVSTVWDQAPVLADGVRPPRERPTHHHTDGNGSTESVQEADHGSDRLFNSSLLTVPRLPRIHKEGPLRFTEYIKEKRLRSYIAHFERFNLPVAISATSVRKAKRIARYTVAPRLGIDLTSRDPAISGGKR